MQVKESPENLLVMWQFPQFVDITKMESIVEVHLYEFLLVMDLPIVLSHNHLG